VNEGLLGDLAGAILDGRPVDWDSAAETADEAERPLLDQLRLLAALADLHRVARVEQWGHLRVFERIGRGAFGEVYRAWDTRLDREVALKLLPAPTADGLADHSLATDSIIHEGRLLARVRHSNVVTIYGAQRIEDRIGLWMEFVKGRTLAQVVEQGKVFSTPEAVDIGIQLCRAMTAVHGAGLLHRDIKANNVMLAEDGRLVLMDFGTGRELGEVSAGLAGTPLYLAPEVLQGEEASVRSDVYSVGVLLYHLVTGSYPVRARGLRDLRLAHERNERTTLRTARPDASPTLARVIERAIDPQPDRRYESADLLAADLAALKTRWTVWIKQVGLAACLLLATLTVSDAPPRARTRPVLPARQSVLIGAFAGTTGDRHLEATLQQVVTAELEQSPYIAVFPASRVREALERMKRPAAATIDEPVGFEICAREGLTAMVSGSVDAFEGQYLVRLRATHTGTKSVLASVQDVRGGREEVMEAALTLTRQLRRKLGETLSVAQAAGPPLEPVTSRSVEAVRHFTLGKQLYDVERPKEALPHFLNAIESDPAFAMGHDYVALTYSYLGDYERQGQFLETAASLASDPTAPVSQAEREKILADRDVYLDRLHEAAAHWRTLLTLRPADGRVMANLGLVYGSLRQYPESIAALEAAWIAYPHPRVRWMLADMYSAVGRSDAATELLGRHLEQPFDWIVYGKHLLVAGQRDAAEAALKEAERRTHQSSGASWADLALVQADFHRSEGRYRDAEAALQQGLDRGGQAGVERLELAMASLLVDWGRRPEAAARLAGIDAQHSRNRIVHGVLAARAGNMAAAARVLVRLEQDATDRRAPRPEARVHQLRAEIALASGRDAEAYAHAGRAVRSFPTAWTLETLARTQRAAGRIPEAIATWTTIVERPGERTLDWDAPAFSRVVLAQYELARLLEQAGRTDVARQRYDEFLRRWDHADPDLPALVDARERRRRLGQGAQSTPPGRVPKPAA
jgi:tetratricopeptide (TPR) repeat protein/tRNA A-37 threonylcarbamoyl transferase component Bud32